MPRTKKEPLPIVDLSTFEPADNKQARRLIAIGVMWYWDHQRRWLLGTAFVLMVILGGLGKFFNLDKYQPVIEEQMEAMTGVSMNPNSDNPLPENWRFITTADAIGDPGMPIVINGKVWAYADDAYLLWREAGTDNLIVYRRGDTSPRRFRDLPFFGEVKK